MSIFKFELEQLRERWEIEERLSPKDRLKKQVKNFGVELEWASQYDFDDELVSETITSLVAKEFGDQYTVVVDGSAEGIQRTFILTDDASAKLDTFDSGVEIIQELANDLAGEFEGFRDRMLEEAEEETDESDYESDESYEEARDELYMEKLSEEENRFFETLQSIIASRIGSDEATHIIQNISLDDLNDFDAVEISDVLEPFARSLGGDSEEGSYEYGVELVSPRLAFEDGNIMRLARLFKGIEDSGIAKFHNNAGLHVHIGRIDNMSIIHFLRMVYYLFENREEVESLSGREFNRWAQDSEDVITRLESLITMNTTDVHTQASYVLSRITSDILSERYRAVNLSSLSKGTVEFRIGSSEIAINPKAIVQWLEFIKHSFDYGVDEDYLEFLGYRFYMNDNGQWKITFDDQVQMSSKNTRVDIGDLKAKDNTERIWNDFVKKFNGREKLKKKLATDIMVIIENDKYLYDFFYGSDGEINMNITAGRLYADYLESGDLILLTKLFKYTHGILSPKQVLEIIKSNRN